MEIKISELKNEMEIPQIQPTAEELEQLAGTPNLFEDSVHDFAFQVREQ